MKITLPAATAALCLGLSLPAEAQAVQPLVPKFDSITAALSQRQGTYFWVERRGGTYHLGDSESQFNGGKDLDLASFDISNNKVLAKVSIQGAIEGMSVYRDTYLANCGSSAAGGASGVWTAKDNSTYGPYSYGLVLDGESHDLASVDWDFRTGLLDNLFPITEMTDPKGRLDIKLITFAPISADGSVRLRGLVYGLLLKNLSAATVQGQVKLPKLSFPNKKRPGPRDSYDPFDFDLALGDGARYSATKSFSLKKGESLWIPTVIFALGDSAPSAIQREGAVGWLRESWQYYRRLLGRLEIPSQPFLAEFYEREAMEALQAIAMSEAGRFAGSNWGTSPTTRQIWTKDCYYACLPFMTLDPALAQKIIPWFDEFDIHPIDVEHEGGINHSVGLTVASPLLASLYYDHTGDKTFLRNHQELKASWAKVLNAVAASRVDPGVWLFPTHWISDGPVAGDYHTGSNVAVWRAMEGYARLLDEVFDDPSGAQIYRQIAVRIRQAIMAKTVIAGVAGPQFIEATYRDGRPPKMISDGEESDATLMPYYGFVPYDNAEYLNFMRFSVSPRNAVYNPRLRSITWKTTVPSTSPAYNKGLCAGLDYDEEFGEHGYYTELRRVTDLDGSVWWWSYGRDRNPVYGRLTRAYQGSGKAGWTAGVHTVLFPSRFLGISFDAPSKKFSFAPFSAIGDFAWTDFPEGNAHFSLSVHNIGGNVRVSFTNKNPEPITFDANLPVAEQGETVKINGVSWTKIEPGSYLNHKTVGFETRVAGGETLNVAIAPERESP